MNILCSKCQNYFSVTAEQLGTRGKCPHCRTTIVLPKSANQAGTEVHQLDPPSFWMQNALCGITAVALHLLALSLLAFVPWGDFSDGSFGEGIEITIGNLPKRNFVELPNEKLDSSQFESLANNDFSESTELDLFSPSSTGSMGKHHSPSQLFSTNQQVSNPLDLQSMFDTDKIAGGNNDFGTLVTQLKKDGLDIVITFDSTGSMQGEIDQVKNQIGRIGTVLFELIPKTRIGVCTYRDNNDEYVVKGLPLTENLGEVVLYLEQIKAKGGGDKPEAVDKGLEWSIEKNDFRRRARKVILLFGDAPPHAKKKGRCLQLASSFRKQGGVVSTVTCGRDIGNAKRMEEFVAIAQIGRGEAFLTRNEREIMTQLMILVFGSQHRSKVIEAFNLLTR